MSPRGASVVLTCAAAACGPSVVQVSLPSLPAGTESWLVGRVDRSGALAVDAADDSAPAVRIAVDDGVTAVEVRALDAPLSAVRLAPGPVARAPEGAASVPLPVGTYAAVAAVSGAEVGPWEEGRVEALDAFRVASNSRCGTLTTSVALMPITGNVEWAVPLGDRTVLLGTSTFEVALLEQDRAPRAVRVVAAGTARPHAAFLDLARRVWLGDDDGGLWVGELSGATLTLQRRAEPLEAGRIRHIDGDPARPEAQLYAITDAGAVLALGPTGWRLADRYALGPDTGDDAYSIVWLFADDVLYAHHGAPTVYRWRDGESRTEFTNANNAGIISMDRHDTGRIVAAMGTGSIAIRDASAMWRELPRAPLSLDVRTTRSYGGGFLYGGSFGYVGQWLADEGFCPLAEMPLAPNTVDFIFPVASELWVFGEARSQTRTPWVQLRVE